MNGTLTATIKYLAGLLIVGAVGGAVALAPIASADTNPAAPAGPTYHVDNQDEIDYSNGFVDRPF
jgi:hypothetical protein